MSEKVKANVRLQVTVLPEMEVVEYGRLVNRVYNCLVEWPTWGEEQCRYESPSYADEADAERDALDFCERNGLVPVGVDDATK